VTVTIGLAGAGRRAADVHAPSLASCPGARFAGIWAPRAQAASAPADNAFDTMFAEFARAARQGTPPTLGGQRGLHLQRVVEEAQTDLIRTA
jgi:predicted dehydrogenase